MRSQEHFLMRSQIWCLIPKRSCFKHESRSMNSTHIPHLYLAVSHGIISISSWQVLKDFMPLINPDSMTEFLPKQGKSGICFATSWGDSIFLWWEESGLIPFMRRKAELRLGLSSEVSTAGSCQNWKGKFSPPGVRVLVNSYDLISWGVVLIPL